MIEQMPLELEKLYLTDPSFSAIVKVHSKNGNDYIKMLEQSVSVLAAEKAKYNDLVVKYATQYGTLAE